MINEEWIKLGGFIGEYYISSDLLNIKKRNKRIDPRTPEFRILCINASSSSGYLTVYMDGKNFLYHRLLAKAFIPNPENKLTVNHINGNKKDNRIENLEWCTYAENNSHAMLSGLNKSFGENVWNSKLKNNDILEIRSIKGLSLRKIAKKYNVSPSAIANIQEFKTWAHIKPI